MLKVLDVVKYMLPYLRTKVLYVHLQFDHATMGKTSKDRRDVFYRKAKEEGFRARSAYKLLEINEQLDIFNDVTCVVDLCASPGGWSQVALSQMSKNADKKKIKIVAIDLIQMAPLKGVIQLKGDIFDGSIIVKLRKEMGRQKADLILCDGAPDLTGVPSVDDNSQAALVERAIAICGSFLKRDGTFVTKIYRGRMYRTLVASVSYVFKTLFIVKPSSSRGSSNESFLVCRCYQGAFMDKTVGWFLEAHSVMQKIPKFINCPKLSGLDSDRSWNIKSLKGDGEYKSLDPVQMPTDPPYCNAVKLRKLGKIPQPGVNINNVVESLSLLGLEKLENEVPKAKSCSRTHRFVEVGFDEFKSALEARKGFWCNAGASIACCSKSCTESD